jgi:hypothetical protein
VEPPEHARRNKAAWVVSEAEYVAPAERNWARHDVYAPPGAAPTQFDWMPVAWAQRWPAEEI